MLTSSAATGNNWYLDDVLIEGAQENILEVDEEGTYQVQVQAGVCSSEFSDPVDVVITGIEFITEVDFLVYPNPNTGRLIIKVPEVLQHENLSVRIYDLNGRDVGISHKNIPGDPEISINISTIGSGQYTYFIEHPDTGHVYRGMFIKH